MKSKFWKTVLPAVLIAILGFALLNVTFMLDFWWQSSLKFIFWRNVELTDNWVPAVMQVSFVVIMAAVCWLIYRSKLGTIFKAAFTMVPVAIVLVFDGMLLFRWPMFAYGVGSLITIGTLVVFYYRKLPWLYWFSVIVVALGMLALGLSGTDI